MSEYRQAVKRLTKDERIVVAHLEELIGEMKAVRVATVLKGQEAHIGREIEKEVMAHLMPDFLAEIQKERNKIDLLLKEMADHRQILNQERTKIEAAIGKLKAYTDILGHVQALAKQGEVEIFVPKPTPTKPPAREAVEGAT